MSELNCGCGCEETGRYGRDGRDCGCGFGNNSCLWIILLLIFCGGCGNGFSGNNCGCGNDSCLWIILLLIFCGGCGNGFSGNNCGCGC